MFDWLNFHILALVVVAAQFGGMVFFAFMFTPMVFKFLDREDGAKLLRKIFPVYYRVMAVAATLSSLFLIIEKIYAVEVVTLLSVAAIFIFAVRKLLPMANKAREKSDTKQFSTVHKTSVVLHLLQFIAVGAVLIRLAK